MIRDPFRGRRILAALSTNAVESFVLSTDQSVLNKFTTIIRGTAGKVVIYDWGDNNTTTVVLNGTAIDNTVEHDYGNTGTYIITIAGALSSITSFTCSENTMTLDLFQLSKLTGLTYFYCSGSKTITGNLSSLPSVMTYFSCYGSNTITGNLSSLPSVMTYFVCTGSNTITGNLSSLPSVMTLFVCTGSNTITGNLSSLPSVLTYFSCAGSNTITDYASGRTWANNMRYLYIRQAVGYGFSTAEVDGLLIDLAIVATWISNKLIDLRGNNAARSSASDAAVATLQGKGVTVYTN